MKSVLLGYCTLSVPKACLGILFWGLLAPQKWSH